jgi:dihydroorotate dehydrogenase (fumarate)
MDYLGELHRGLTEWMDLKGYGSVAEMKGAMSRQRMADPEAFDRANYIKVLESYRNPYLL